MPISNAADARDSGYTLAELLIVLALAAAVSTIFTGLVSSGRPGEARGAALAVAGALKTWRTQALADAERIEIRAEDGRLVASSTSGAWEVAPARATLRIEGTHLQGEDGRIAFSDEGLSNGGTVIVSTGTTSLRVVVHAVTGRVDIDE